MSFTIRYEKRALKELSKLPRSVVKQILAKIRIISHRSISERYQKT
jgi:mRNA-degrading endonuclease RelE of RelBE toxin-antitoxin system